MRLDPQLRLRSSARGWSGIQVALMGFIGLCGVLQTPSGPYWLQITGGLLALAALGAAVLGAVLVALVAWPLGERDPVRAPTLLRGGVGLTFAAAALIGLAGLTGWWPGADPATKVEVADALGRKACGDLAESGSGSVTLRVDGTEVAVPLKSLASLRAVASCP